MLQIFARKLMTPYKWEGLVRSIAHCQSNCLFILLERVEMEICFPMANGMFKMKMDIDCHGPRLMLNNCQHLDPPYFSLPTTFKWLNQQATMMLIDTCVMVLQPKGICLWFK
jgi:hypothetical protein